MLVFKACCGAHSGDDNGLGNYICYCEVYPMSDISKETCLSAPGVDNI